PARPRTRGDADVAGVAIRRDERVDRVRAAAALADLLEEPRARAVAERRVQYGDRVARRIRDRYAARPEHELHLLELALVHRNAAARRRHAVVDRGSAAVEVAEAGADRVDERGVVHLPGGGDDQSIGAIACDEQRQAGVAVEARDARARATDRRPERVLAPVLLVEEIVDEVVGRVLDLRDLLEHDLTLARDVVG